MTAHIPVLGKTIQVLEALAEGTTFRSMSQMARALGIAPATCYRILKTLERADWVRTDAQGGHRLSLGLLSLVTPLRVYERLAMEMQPRIDELARVTGLSVKLSVRIGDEAATVARGESPEAMSVSGRVGARFPLAVGSSGSALLSTLEDEQIEAVMARTPTWAWRHQTVRQVWARVRACRRQGFCHDRGSYHPQVHSLSAPLRRSEVEVATAALTVLGLPDDLGPGRVPHLTQRLLEAVQQAGPAVPQSKASVAQDMSRRRRP